MLALCATAAAMLAPSPAGRPGVARRVQITRMGAPPALGSLLELAEQYDAFLLDQFGVIHDGKDAYAGAVEAVSELQRLGKKVIIISNSSRRRGDTADRLRSMGFGPVVGDEHQPPHLPPIDVVTSGDLVFDGLLAGDSEPFADLGIRCFVFGNGADDEQYVRECGKVASPIGQADFVLARGLFSMLGAGPDMLRQPASAYTPELEASVLDASLARAPGGLPLLVANPDEVRPDGADSPMPGQLARRYAALGGGDIRLVGKPHPLIYEACRAKLAAAGFGADARVAAVGDSLHHDVLGAARNGVDSVFICGGVHYSELGVPQAQAVPPDAERLGALLDGFADETGGCAPTHVLAGFVL